VCGNLTTCLLYNWDIRVFGVWRIACFLSESQFLLSVLSIVVGCISVDGLFVNGTRTVFNSELGFGVSSKTN
jgi:hypothetical protein